MAARAQRAVRVSSWAGVAILIVGLALAAAAPAVAATSQATVAASRSATVSGPKGVQAKAAAIAVASTGRVLWSRDLNTELPMASITKVMTALVVIRAGDLGRKITVPSAVVGYVAEHDASNAGLRPGTPSPPPSCWRACCCPPGPTPLTPWPRRTARACVPSSPR